MALTNIWHVEEYVKSDVEPVWTGNGWKYCGVVYPSLRILKTRSSYKVYTRLVASLKEAIKYEIDNEILTTIRGMQGSLISID